MPEQLSLEVFEGMSHAGRNRTCGVGKLPNIIWSYSRRNLLEQCPRRYYFTYYGANKKTALHQENKEFLWFLKGMPNRYERAGTILHLVVAKSLRDSLNGGAIDPERLQRWARSIFEKDIEYSQSDPEGRNPPWEKFPPVLLWEFYSGVPEANQKCQETLTHLCRSVDTFARSSTYAAFRDLRRYKDVLIEKWISVPGLPFRVTGRIDLALSTSTETVVLDWKMGEVSNGEDSLQLASYALWACQHFDVEPESVQLLIASLGSDSLMATQFTDVMLRRGRARIMQDAELMGVMDSYGMKGRAEAFSPCAQPAVCSLCPFLSACQEGRDCIGS